jgi:RNA polymerase sigma-70 factor (ECF subfamily)
MTRSTTSPRVTDIPARELIGGATTVSETIGRARDGDVTAFEQLTAPHADRLYAVVLRLVDNRSDAEDVVQETLLRAWRGIGRFQGRSAYFTWLYRIALNEANRTLEKRSRAATGVAVDEQALQLAAPEHEEPASQAEQHDLGRALDRAIADLAPAHRAVLVLRDIEGLSTREAAEIVGIGEAAFKSRLHQARLQVRATLGDAALIEAVV